MNHRRISPLKWLLLIVLVVGSVVIIWRNSHRPYRHMEGNVFGTTFHITYQSAQAMDDSIARVLLAVDESLSAFNPRSTLSRINQNRTTQTDTLLREVFILSREVSRATGGDFDVTVAPLVNLWGFGFKHSSRATPERIDSIRRFVGWEKVNLIGGRIVKQDPRTLLDLSAVAKGYGSDCVARLLRRHGVKNFLVEIGGEVVAQGNNAEQKPWRIGIDRPVEDSTATHEALQTVLEVRNRALATSGNYRRYYYKEGRRYAHTIDPHTGLPVQHELLSATVLAPTCARADAFATAFMVGGLEKAKACLRRNPDLQAYLIYNDKAGNLKVWTNYQPE